jgi:glycosyltransferase involved in cell wall biosynthesis
MTAPPRVALFCETYHEINGVALTARQLVSYAKRHGLPFLAVHGGLTPGAWDEGGVRRIELKRAWLSIGIESDLQYDLFFWRYLSLLKKEVQAFRPDIIHVTSPGELGQLGAYLCHSLNIPLVASWHTNFHQFAARRLQKALNFLPGKITRPTSSWVQLQGLRLQHWFYGMAKVTLAPTTPQVEWLEKKLHRPCFLMSRGVDSEQFHPSRRAEHDGVLRIGFVGRVTPEKGVRLLAKIEAALEAAGMQIFRILVVGDGSEMNWLKKRLRHGEFTGVLRGDDLARAYANMDLFAFPSRTDTFGNVIQEAAASGVPSVVTNEGGPKHLVVHGQTGYVAETDDEFVARLVELARDPERLKRMGAAARERVLGASWDKAFDQVYVAYEHCRRISAQAAAAPEALVAKAGM